MNSNAGSVDSSLDFDPVVLRRKYEEERNKRIRPDGIGQYLDIDRDFPGFDSDPFMDVEARDAIRESVDVLIVGAGIGGLLAASKLVNVVGVDNIRLIDRAGDFGGTWYWNRYPGARCDVESYIYMPLLEETGYIPREKYSTQEEILEHCARVGDMLGLRRRSLFHTTIDRLQWRADEGGWQVVTDRDDDLHARYVVLATGPLDKAKLPGIPGMENFDGHVFHTNRWDYDYTGARLEKLTDKRVAVIGTGASAIQCVPRLAESAKELLVFQRTPAVINPRDNAPTTPVFAGQLAPGWQSSRMENYTAHVLGILGEGDEDFVDDGWTHACHKLFSVYGSEASTVEEDSAAQEEAELTDFAVMNEVRRRIDKLVTDPATADLLKPWYRFFCKRPLFSDDYLPSFNKSNVRLIDTGGAGVDEICGDAVKVSGVSYGVDCIIFATGFEVGTDFAQRVGFEITGSRGETLSEHWRNGYRTMHGIQVHGFPNLFFVGSGQVGFTLNYPEMADKQAIHVAWLIEAARKRGVTLLEPSASAEQEYLQVVIDAAEASLEFQAQCTPSYLNSEGQPKKGGKGIIDGQYAGGIVEWWRILSEWREQGDLNGLTLR